MRSGKARYKVVLSRRTDLQKPSGGVTFSWVPFASVWAEVAPGRGREFFAAAQIQATAFAEIKIRYRDDVDETCRVSVTRRYASPQITEHWDVGAPPVPDEKTMRRDLLLYCTKGTAEGWRG